MKIMEKDGSMINVFGIYWQNNETYFSGFDKSYEGLTSFSLNEVEIIDSKMNFKTVFLTNHMSGVFHWALIEENLLDALIDHDPIAVERFLQIIKNENLIF